MKEDFMFLHETFCIKKPFQNEKAFSKWYD